MNGSTDAAVSSAASLRREVADIGAAVSLTGPTGARRLRIGVFVGEEKWGFIRPVHDDLRQRHAVTDFVPVVYRTPLLHGRLNRWAYRHGVRALLRQSDVALFEWASEKLAEATRLPRICPIVTRLHAFELFVWAQRIDWDRVDRIIFVGEHMRRRFDGMYPAHASKGVVVPNGVDVERFRPPASRPRGLRIGILGDLHPRKRQYEAVLLVHKLRGLGYPAHLHLGGGRWPGGYFDDYHAGIQHLVESLGMRDHVTEHGPVSTPDAWLREIDVFLSHSYFEGMQVALLEAMASGCYCLSHGWCGANEVLPPEYLYLDDDACLARIAAYFDSPAGAQRAHQERLRQRACAEFDVRRMSASIRRVLEEVARA